MVSFNEQGSASLCNRYSLETWLLVLQFSLSQEGFVCKFKSEILQQKALDNAS